MNKKLISCAACKITLVHETLPQRDLILADNCHFGRNMQGFIKLFLELGYTIEHPKDTDRGQGFLDESGNYLGRSEAYKIAVSSGQPFNSNYTLPDYKLDSSCIRHFPKTKHLVDFCKR